MAVSPIKYTDFDHERQELTQRNFLSLRGYLLGGVAALGSFGFVGRFF